METVWVRACLFPVMEMGSSLREELLENVFCLIVMSELASR